MANVIKCSNCGESNPADQEFCQFCQTRLQPLTGPLKGLDAAIKPGASPTKKMTSELEPILPQWLREARDTARASDQNDMSEMTKPIPPPAASKNDLLAGLQSQAGSDEEEDVPDWLANITGAAPKPKKNHQDTSDVRWVELGSANDFAKDEPASDDGASPWLAGASPSQTKTNGKDELSDWFREASGTQDETPQPSPDDTTEWLRGKTAENKSQQAFNEPVQSFGAPPESADTPIWLRGMAAEDNNQQAFNKPAQSFGAPSESADTPNWLRGMAAEDNNQPAFNEAAQPFGAPPESTDTPDWLRGMAAEDNNQQVFNEPVPSFNASTESADTPDWLRGLDAGDNNQQGFNEPAQSFETPTGSANTPDWLRGLGADNAPAQSADLAPFGEASAGAFDSSASDADTPDWLKGLGSETPVIPSSSEGDWMKGLQSSQPAAAAQNDTPAWLSESPATPPQNQAPAQDDPALGDIPNWLKAAAPQSSIYEETATQQEATPVEPSDTPDWLSAFKSVDAAPQAPDPMFSMDAEPPAFTSDSNAGGNVDGLFTEMPDWLSNAESPLPSSSSAGSNASADSLAAGELPSWVQAMRPVDPGVRQPASSSRASDQTLESRGALAGLQGVLPAAPGYAPTSKPKAYSIKLESSDEQLAQAALLEQILNAETAPVPITSLSGLRTSRGLRWSLSVALIVCVTIVLSLGTQIFSMPVGIPAELNGAVQIAQSIPEGSPVLVVFDYEPARAGEMETAAAPMFDQMILLRHPLLTFISTNENGSILVERFIAGPLAGHSYQSGLQYLNLGYLPGGQMGIHAFAENPVQTSPFDIYQNAAWQSAPLQGVNSISQFTAMIIVTDSASSARIWIEQTTSRRGAIPVVVVSSAQAAPMIQPYYASHQVSGLVSGLYGSALFEQQNAGRPGTARIYWDAYSLGMLLAVFLLVAGGFWNLGLGARDRAAAREAK